MYIFPELPFTYFTILLIQLLFWLLSVPPFSLYFNLLLVSIPQIIRVISLVYCKKYIKRNLQHRPIQKRFRVYTNEYHCIFMMTWVCILYQSYLIVNRRHQQTLGLIKRLIHYILETAYSYIYLNGIFDMNSIYYNARFQVECIQLLNYHSFYKAFTWQINYSDKVFQPK